MTRELLAGFLNDDIFRYGLGFGILFGMVLGYVCCMSEYAIAKLLKYIKRKDKDK